MSAEAQLVALLKTVCPSVRPIVSATENEKPFIVYQNIGGSSWRYADNTPANNRQSVFQVSVWAATFAEALDIIRDIEDVLCASTAMQITTNYEPIALDGSDQGAYGLTQDFEVVAIR